MNMSSFSRLLAEGAKWGLYTAALFLGLAALGTLLAVYLHVPRLVEIICGLAVADAAYAAGILAVSIAAAAVGRVQPAARVLGFTAVAIPAFILTAALLALAMGVGRLTVTATPLIEAYAAGLVVSVVSILLPGRRAS